MHFMQFFGKAPLDEAEQNYREAMRYRNRKKKEFNFDLAVYHFEEAIRLQPYNPIYHCRLGGLYVGAPLLAITRGLDWSGRLSEILPLAIAELEEAIRLKPDYPEAHLVLGEAYMYLGQKAKAIKSFRAVLDLTKDGVLRDHAEREMLHVEQGISSESQPDKAREHIERAIAHRDRGKHRQAEKELDCALKLAPDWVWVYRTACELGG
jgi:tetratricopeptide (TPR) repeat protein